jgi:hypothetical protein
MNQLFPIIRRKRRPLVVADVPPIPTKTKSVQPVVKTPEVEPAAISKPDNGKNLSNPESE